MADRRATEPPQLTEAVVLRNRVTQLRQLQKLRNEKAALLESLSRSRFRSRSPGDNPRKRRRRNRFSSSLSKREIKVKNIIRLTATSSFRQRNDWIADLERAFEGIPKRYKTNARRILLALNYIDSKLRKQWNRYAHEKITNSDWNTFMTWSL